MAEVDPIDPFEPHEGGGDENEGQENWHDGHDDEGYDQDSHRLEVERQDRRDAMRDLISNGLKAPPDLYYAKAARGGEVFYGVSEDNVKWYGIKYGFGENGQKLLGLIPLDGKDQAPDRLYVRLGIENQHQVEETTEGPVEYLKRVFDDPRLEGVSFGTIADDRVWVSLSRTNAVKYFIREDGTVEDIGGKVVNLPKGLKTKLGSTIVEATAEREEKVKQNREREEYLKSLQEKDQVNIELRERNERLENSISRGRAEMSRGEDAVRELREKLKEREEQMEKTKADVANLREKSNLDEEKIKELQGQVTENSNLTKRLEALRGEVESLSQSIVSAYKELHGAVDEINAQKRRIEELEERNKELEGLIADENEEIERNSEKDEVVKALQKEKADLMKNLQESKRELDEKNESLVKMQKHQESLGVDIANLQTKADFDKKRIKDLQDELANSISPSEKAKLKADLNLVQIEVENANDLINQKQARLDQAGRDIYQQKQRITELEMQKEELEATNLVLREEVERNVAQIERNEREIGDQDLNNAEQELQELERENEQLEEQNQEAFDRLSLKEKVKTIFRKYGVTVIGVLAAVGTIIGVIVSNLKAGLTKVAKGVGNGLKEIGRKLGQILPGMVGAIVSFLFNAAGSVISFLGKNAWLLILLVVTFVIEQFKRRKGSKEG